MNSVFKSNNGDSVNNNQMDQENSSLVFNIPIKENTKDFSKRQLYLKLSKGSIYIVIMLALFAIYFLYYKVFPLKFSQLDNFMKKSVPIYRFGTYKPNLIFAINEISGHKSFGMDLMYLVKQSYSNAYRYRVMNNAEFSTNFVAHDGKEYFEEVIEEKLFPFALRVTAFRENIYGDQQKWVAMIESSQIPKIIPEQEKIIFLLAFHVDDLVIERNHRLEFSSYFRKNSKENDSFIFENSDKKIGEINFQILNQTNHEFHYKLFNFSREEADNFEVKLKEFLFLNEDIDDQEESCSNTLLLKIKVPLEGYFKLIVQYSEIKEDYQIKQSILQSFEEKKTSFLKRFNLVFPISENIISYEKCNQASFANLMGGITYMYGGILVANKEERTQELPLITASPSRPFFPRGFLWDEGFHNLIICQYDQDLCFLILESWLNTEMEGWIPREQARGKEAESHADKNFLEQNPKEANPPTILIPLRYLINQFKNDPSHLDRFSKLLPILNKWFDFLKKTQNTDAQNIYGWKIRKSYYNLGSGLDDYPRNDGFFTSEYHLDLQVWMAYFSESLNYFCETLKTTDCKNSKKNYQDIKEQLNFFLDKGDNLYKDRGPDSTFSKHLGYVNLFPLFFGYLDVNSEAFLATLELIEDQKLLGSNFGVRSLSKSDDFFHKNDDYWTGPIWININYLILRGLKMYYFQNERAKMLYNDLRQKLIGNVCEDWKKTGFFWENYNEEKGGGTEARAHPFNGWTSLITLIISEKYI